MEIELPLDHDGFLRRECPSCEREFKWHHGPANEEAERQPPQSSYFCPLCGRPAGEDSWWTQEQLALIDGAGQTFINQQLNSILDDAFGGMRDNGLLRVESSKRLDGPSLPQPLVETDDMTIVASPCHPWEPIKVPLSNSLPLFCLICGAAFAV
jgi:hypothetical protein